MFYATRTARQLRRRGLNPAGCRRLMRDITPLLTTFAGQGWTPAELADWLTYRVCR